MIRWDDILPTRDGEATGKANERVMLQKVGGANAPRTVIRSNPDGTETMLKTGAGFSRFTTTKKKPSASYGPYWPLTERRYSERTHFSLRSTLPVTGEACMPFSPLASVTMLDRNGNVVVLQLKEPEA